MMQRTGQYSLAVAALQNYLRRVPTDSNGWLTLAYAYKRQGKYMATLKVVERIESLQSNSSTKTSTNSTTDVDPDVLLKACVQ